MKQHNNITTILAIAGFLFFSRKSAKQPKHGPVLEFENEQHIAQWRGKRDVNLEHEITTLTKRLHSIKETSEDKNIEVKVKQKKQLVKQTKKKVKAAKKQQKKAKKTQRKLLVLTPPTELQTLQSELTDIEEQLQNIGDFLPRKLQMKTTIPVTSGFSKDRHHKEKLKESLSFITKTLKKSKRKEFISKPKEKRKTEAELQAEHAAIEEVQRISARLAKKYPNPPNELIQIDTTLQKIKQQLQQEKEELNQS